MKRITNATRLSIDSLVTLSSNNVFKKNASKYEITIKADSAK